MGMSSLGLGTRRQWGRDLAIATAVGLFLGLLGPFGSYLNGAAPVRIAYWTGAVWVGVAVQGLSFRLARIAAGRWRLPVWLALAVATPLAAIPIAGVCRGAAIALWPHVTDYVGIGEWYVQTCLISTPFAIAYAILDRPRSTLDLPEEAISPSPFGGDTDSDRSFLARLPSHLGRDLVALQMEDHYVRAHTGAGSALLLIPLHRAIAELKDVPGLRVHRSWWVARRAVVDCQRDGRNVRLRLSNGIEAPVARASVATVKTARLPGADRL